MSIPISLPKSLGAFLDEERRERGDESLDACAGRLIRRAQRLSPPRRTFEVGGRAYRLTRLSDGQEFDLHRTTIAIKTDPAWEYALALAAKLDLAETYAVCRHLFGERARCFDDYKGDFAFPLALEVPGAARRPAYMFTVMNFRSSIEYNLRKLVDATDERLKDPLYYPPDADEFPQADLQRFVSFFVSFLQGFFESFRTRWKDRFLLAVQSNLILYGFDGEKFFTRDFESCKEFKQSQTALAERLPTPGFYGGEWDWE